ncbi:MAG TPA: hypothetical protein VFF73_29670 [Planctomycetota bacterium]|nr:hypothetical protein [Planctomycetota bacterium]
MRRTSRTLAYVLAAALPAAGCATTHLSGEYRTSPTTVSMKEGMRTLDEGSAWPLFWGLFDAGSYDAGRELSKKLRPDEVVTSLEVKERLSVGGFFLWLITAGIVSHHTIEINGRTSVSSRPPAEPATGGGPVAPARADKSGDWNEGYRDGLRDKGRVVITGDGPVKPDRSADYNEGYRDALNGR